LIPLFVAVLDLGGTIKLVSDNQTLHYVFFPGRRLQPFRLTVHYSASQVFIDCQLVGTL